MVPIQTKNFTSLKDLKAILENYNQVNVIVNSANTFLIPSLGYVKLGQVDSTETPETPESNIRPN